MAIDIESPGASEAALRAALDSLKTYRGARAYRSSNETTANYTTQASIPMEAADVDTDSFWSAGAPGRLTIPAGLGITHVRVNAATRVQDVSSGAAILGIRQSSSGGTAKSNRQNTSPVISAVQYVNVDTGVVPVADGDYFEARLQEETDTSVTVVGGTAPIWTYITIEVVGMELV